MGSPSPALPRGAVVTSLRTERQVGAQASGVMLNPTALPFSLSLQYRFPIQPPPPVLSGFAKPEWIWGG